MNFDHFCRKITGFLEDLLESDQKASSGNGIRVLLVVVRIVSVSSYVVFPELSQELHLILGHITLRDDIDINGVKAGSLGLGVLPTIDLIEMNFLNQAVAIETHAHGYRNINWLVVSYHIVISSADSERVVLIPQLSWIRLDITKSSWL
jgi:hypothetical protein